MVQKFISKHEKHTKDDERRKESLQKKLKEKQNQKELIKRALSSTSTGNSKKIIFDEELLDRSGNEEKCKVHYGNVCSGLNESGVRKALFADSENDEEEYEIKIKNQFEGKEGQKLLKLQSNYNNDERFRLDERFKDDDEDGDVDEEYGNDENSCEGSNKIKGADSDRNELNEEKVQQLKVLESVLGHSVQVPEKTEKKLKRSYYEMVRFDASNEDHRRQENNEGSTELHTIKKKKKKLDKEERKKRKKEGHNEEVQSVNELPPSTDGKFYEVSNDLKMALKNRTQEEKQFSLLATFSRKEVGGEHVTETEGVDVEDQIEIAPDDSEMSHEEVLASPKHERREINEEKVSVAKVQGIAKEKFFFTEDDPRIEEGLSFINMKDSEEARKAVENYDETRKDIREVLRLRWQKHRQRNNPFRKKIGGRSNRQITTFTKNRKNFGRPYARRR